MKRPTIIDIEASGFGKGSYPIEVGYVDPLGQTWCALVAPQDDCVHWDQTAEALHHIQRDTLLQHGKPAAVIAKHLNAQLSGQTVYTDGWYQDFTWLNRLFDMANMRPTFKLEDLRAVLSPFQESIWHETKRSITEGLHLTRHRASTDALALQLTWVKTAESELIETV